MNKRGAAAKLVKDKQQKNTLLGYLRKDGSSCKPPHGQPNLADATRSDQHRPKGDKDADGDCNMLDATPAPDQQPLCDVTNVRSL
jgi:hypothetical protein